MDFKAARTEEGIDGDWPFGSSGQNIIASGKRDVKGLLLS